MDREELKAIVAQMLRELAPAQTPPSPPPVKGAETAPEAPPDDGVLPDLTTVDLRAQYLVPNAAHGAEFRALKAKTPARLGLGRCGARYPTASLLRFRADHAAAQDSVFSLVPERFWEENHYPFVQTMCKSKDEYLTRPDLGRRFDEKNQAVLRDLLAGQRVVLAVGDGLSSAAVQANAPDCCAAIRQGLQAQGIELGPVPFIQFCRVGAGDHIGDLTDCEVICLLVGERRLPDLPPAHGHCGVLPHRRVEHPPAGRVRRGGRGAHRLAPRPHSGAEGLRHRPAGGRRMTGAPVPVRVLCARTIANVSPGLSRALSLDPGQNSIALLATDCDDVTYLALDEATKAANVSVVYGRSLYAGAGNAPTPLTGEVIGLLAGPTPADARSGLAAALAFLQDGPRFREAENGVFYLAHCAARTGTYLSRAAHIPAGQPLAYLIAPPVPALLGLDAALKAAGVELAEFYAPPTETNYAGALLTGTRSACLAACIAFAGAVCEAAARPLEAEGTRRNDHGI